MSTRFNPCFGWCVFSVYNCSYMPAEVGIKSCRHAGGCVSFVYECSYPAAIVFDQTHVISIGNTGW